MSVLSIIDINLVVREGICLEHGEARLKDMWGPPATVYTLQKVFMLRSTFIRRCGKYATWLVSKL